MASRVVLYTRPGCHLCDDARTVVASVCSADGVAWEESVVDDDPDLAERFGERVPVLEVDGVVRAFWDVDAASVRAALRSLRD